MEEGTPHLQQLQQPVSLEEQKIIPTPLVASPNADPHARLPPLRRKGSTHVFYNYTQPTSPVAIPDPGNNDCCNDRVKIKNLINADEEKDAKYLLPEPAVSIAYRHNVDAQF